MTSLVEKGDETKQPCEECKLIAIDPNPFFLSRCCVCGAAWENNDHNKKER